MAGGGIIGFLSSIGERLAVSAANPLPVTNSGGTAPKDATYTPLGYQQIIGLAASTPLTVPGGAKYALITCESQIVRWRDDGIAPTAAIGMQLPPNSAILYDGDLAAIRFIQTAVSATLNVSYYS